VSASIKVIASDKGEEDKYDSSWDISDNQALTEVFSKAQGNFCSSYFITKDKLATFGRQQSFYKSAKKMFDR